MFQSWKVLWPFVRPYRARLLMALFLGFVLAQLTVILPVLVNAIFLGFQKKSLLDDPNFLRIFRVLGLSEDHPWLLLEPRELVTRVAFLLPVYYFSLGLVRYFHYFFMKYLGEQVISDIRIALMKKFMELDVLYLSRQQKGSGGVLSRTLNDTVTLQHGLQFFIDLVREPILASFLIGYMFFISWKVTLGCLLFAPIFIGIIRFITKSLRRFGHQSQEALEDVTRTLKEGLDGVRVIQSFNLQGMVHEKFRRQVENYLSKRRKIIKREELSSPVSEWLASILVCLVCLFQADLIWRGESDVSTFLSFLMAAGLLQQPIKKLQQAFIYVQQNIVALDRIQEVLSSRTEVQEPTSPKSFPAVWQSLDFQGVHFSYNDKPLLKNINLSIRRGEVVALVGESGSGKSTLVGLLQRFFDPDRGEIRIGETRIQELTTQDLRAHIGYVTQDVFLFDESIANNIWFGDMKRSRSDIEPVAQLANAKNFIESKEAGFQTSVGERGGKLSGGERQRVSIARALFKDPPILILDEATSALDSASEREVQKGIESLLKGRTAIVIAHRLSTIMNCDRILVMRDGEIVEEGDHQSLLARNADYAKFYHLQTGQH